MHNSDATTKYLIRSKISADGVIERPDVVGAIFGQTEGLLGNDLDLRDLQKSGRIGRINVNLRLKNGKARGTIDIPSSLDKVETAILAAALETIDRIGPCVSKIEATKIEDVRSSKRKWIVGRAKEILTESFDATVPESQEITEEVKQSVRTEDISYWGAEKLPAGPNIDESDAILVVEGRADVLNLLKYGIKNAIAIGGTNVPSSIAKLSRNKVVTAFTDGDRGGELIIKELLRVADTDYIARAPDGKGVEELVQKEIVRALRQKMPVDRVRDYYLHPTPRRRYVERVEKVEEEVVEDEPELEAQPPQQVEEEVMEEVEVDIKVEDEQTPLKKHVEEVNGTGAARLLDEDFSVLREVNVADFAQTLKELNGSVKAAVFDGVITQRLLDIAATKGIDYLVGAKLGSLVKTPANVKFMTFESA
ncbi:MAG: DNA primase DnaG [Methermicoccaceae archaeon]